MAVTKFFQEFHNPKILLAKKQGAVYEVQNESEVILEEGRKKVASWQPTYPLPSPTN